MANHKNSFGTRKLVNLAGAKRIIFSLSELEKQGIGNIHRLPFSIKILLEALLRQEDGFEVTRTDILSLVHWEAKKVAPVEIPFKPARVILQDFTGVPAVVDLAALRSAAIRLGGDAQKINPKIPVDLVIDHSVQVDMFASHLALSFNAEREFERNQERYQFLKWGSRAFASFRVVPPATGIVHQVNLEFLARVVQHQELVTGEKIVYPDSLVGTDSHTTMINGLGVLGWGVGGIEAEAVMLGQPIYMLMPEVIGFKLTGELPEGVTATDLVLRVTQMLRAKGVVGKFVEYYGPGLKKLSLPDRATLANMAPEYGATVGFFPVDEETLKYLRLTGRSAEMLQQIEAYCKEQELFMTEATPEPFFSDTLELDMSSVEPSLAGPKRPQDRITLAQVKSEWHRVLTLPVEKRGFGLTPEKKSHQISIRKDDVTFALQHGSVVIAAITSCTNTSNPTVMIGAGLLAKKAVQAGLKQKPWVKTSLAPGSKVVTRYLEASGLSHFLDDLGFQTVGYGCTTCIGNSGPLAPEIAKGINDHKLVAVSILSGNRNFEGRISPEVQANYLASPPLVVAYAIAGTIDIDLKTEPLGFGNNGQPVFLKDVWPGQNDIRETIHQCLSSDLFVAQYQNVFDGNPAWNAIPVSEAQVYEWDVNSTYIQEPPFFKNLTPEVLPKSAIKKAKVLAWMPDSTTTDHISPAGSISPTSPAGKFLIQQGVEPIDFNSYGARRGNHEVMMRGTLANIRIKNKLIPGVEGGYTLYQPTGERMAIWDAAVRYIENATPLIILAGKEYGTGSSRDWAAKGVYLQGIRAIIAESYERIHRSNLVGMGILPLQFKTGQSAESLGLKGFEDYDILEPDDILKPRAEIKVRATRKEGQVIEFLTDCRIDTPVEVNYYKNGGILNMVLRNMLE